MGENLKGRSVGPQQPQGVRDHDDRRAGIGEDGHPQRRDTADAARTKAAFSASEITRFALMFRIVARLRRSA